LGCRHRLAGKRQFTQDHFADRPTPAPPHQFFACGICLGSTSGNFATQQLDGRLKPLLSGLDQFGFLGFLFAEGERRLSVSFQGIQVRAGFLK
jgi:hypothetical protein